MFQNLFLKNSTSFKTKLAQLSENQIEEMRKDMLKHCRLCLVNKGCVDVQNDEWTNKFYKLNIELVSQYKLPSTICRCCETAINAFYHKKETFDKNQWTLLRIARTLQKKKESNKDSKFLPDHLVASMDSVKMETCNQVYKSILNCKSENIPIVFGTFPCMDNKDEIVEMTPIGTMSLEDLKNVTLIEIKEAENENYKECVGYDEKRYGVDSVGKINKPVSSILTDWNDEDDDVQPMENAQENYSDVPNGNCDSSIVDSNKEEINDYYEESSQIPCDEDIAEVDNYEEQVDNYDEQYTEVYTHKQEVIENMKPNSYESNGDVYDSNAYEKIKNESYLVNNILYESVNQTSTVNGYENHYRNNLSGNNVSDQFTSIPHVNNIINGDNHAIYSSTVEYAESGYGSQPVEHYDGSEHNELENESKPFVNPTECDSQPVTVVDNYMDLFSERSLNTIPTKEKVTRRVIEAGEMDSVLKRCRKKRIPPRFSGFEENECNQWQWKVKVLETLTTLFKQESTSSNEEIKEKIHSLLLPKGEDKNVAITSNVRLNGYLSVKVDKGNLNKKLAEISVLSKKQLDNLCFANIFEDVIPVVPLDTVAVDKEKEHTEFVVKHGTPKLVFNKLNVPEFNFKLNTYGKPTCVKVNSVPQAIQEQLSQNRTLGTTPQSSRTKSNPQSSRPSRGNQVHTSVSPAVSVAIHSDVDPLTGSSSLNVVSDMNESETTRQRLKVEKPDSLVSRTDRKQPELTKTKAASPASQFNEHAPLAQLAKKVATLKSTVSTPSSTQNLKSESSDLVDSTDVPDEKNVLSNPPTPIKNLPQFLRSLKKMRVLPSEMIAKNAMEPKPEVSVTSNDSFEDTSVTIVYEDENICATNRLTPNKRISETYAQAHVKKRKLLSSAGAEGQVSAYANSNDSTQEDCPTAALCDQIYDIAQGKRPSNVRFLENLSKPVKKSIKEVKPLSYEDLSNVDLNKNKFSPQTTNFETDPSSSCEMKNIPPQVNLENSCNNTVPTDDSAQNEVLMSPCEMKHSMENVKENIVLNNDSTQNKEVTLPCEAKELTENVVDNIISTNEIHSNEDMVNQKNESYPKPCDIDKQNDQVFDVPKTHQFLLKAFSTTTKNSPALKVRPLEEIQSSPSQKKSIKSNNKSTTDRSTNSTKSNKKPIKHKTSTNSSTYSSKKRISNKKSEEKRSKKFITQLERAKLNEIIKEQALLLIGETWHKKKEPTKVTKDFSKANDSICDNKSKSNESNTARNSMSLKKGTLTVEDSNNTTSQSIGLKQLKLTGDFSKANNSICDERSSNKSNTARNSTSLKKGTTTVEVTSNTTSQPNSLKHSKVIEDFSNANDSICNESARTKSITTKNSTSLKEETTKRSISNSSESRSITNPSLVKNSVTITNEPSPSTPQRSLVTPIKFTPLMYKIINGIKQLAKSPPSPNNSSINSPIVKDKLVQTNVTKSQRKSHKLKSPPSPNNSSINSPIVKDKLVQTNVTKSQGKSKKLQQTHKTPPNKTKGTKSNAKSKNRASSEDRVTKSNPSTSKKSRKPNSRHSLPNTKASSGLTTSKTTPHSSSILNVDGSKKHMSYAAYQIKFLFDQVICPSECIIEDFEVPYKFRRKL